MRLKVLRYQKKSERLESELKEARMVRAMLAGCGLVDAVLGA